MYAYANAIDPASLPLALSRLPYSGPRRRRGVAGHPLDAGHLDRFNGLLARLGRPDPLDCDQIVTAARALPPGGDGRAAPCIAELLERAASMSRMLADRAWDAVAAAVPAAHAVVDYIRERNDLIPDWVPGDGRLDDAILVEQAWPIVSAEVTDYLDFCRLRELEAALRGTDAAGFRFSRTDWLESRRAEAALRMHRRATCIGSYGSAPATLFRVHSECVARTPRCATRIAVYAGVATRRFRSASRRRSCGLAPDPRCDRSSRCIRQAAATAPRRRRCRC